MNDTSDRTIREKAALFVLLGQSNATGYAVPMRKEDYINDPMKNLFGLHRRPNQSYDSTELTWSGYTSHGMNLAEELPFYTGYGLLENTLLSLKPPEVRKMLIRSCLWASGHPNAIEHLKEENL